MQLEYLSIAGFMFVIMLIVTVIVEACTAGLPAIANGQFSVVGFTDICEAPRSSLSYHLPSFTACISGLELCMHVTWQSTSQCAVYSCIIISICSLHSADQVLSSCAAACNP